MIAMLTNISDVLVTGVMVTLTVIWIIFTFHMRHSQGKMYSGHGHLCVLLMWIDNVKVLFACL